MTRSGNVLYVTFTYVSRDLPVDDKLQSKHVATHSLFQASIAKQLRTALFWIRNKC